jgi:hypothetical protein
MTSCYFARNLILDFDTCDECPFKKACEIYQKYAKEEEGAE